MKIYINLKNTCDCSCPWCAFNKTIKSTHIKYMELYELQCIISNAIRQMQIKGDDELIVHLEGCSPTLHPNFYIIIHYLCEIEEITQINLYFGQDIEALHDYWLGKLIELSQLYNKDIVFNFVVSDNIIFYDNEYYHNNSTIAIIYSTIRYYINQFIKNDIKYNIYVYTQSIDTYKLHSSLASDANIFPSNLRLNKSIIDIFDNNWCCYASDGTNFGKDVIKRKEYEYLKRIN